MEFFYIPIVVGLLAMSIGLLIDKSKLSKSCKLHKWSTDIQGGYFCTECKRRPGEITTDYDKPY